ncbi:MAG: hypothetical protein ACW97G_16220 [Candidatus Thorarchaeota archaeon]
MQLLEHVLLHGSIFAVLLTIFLLAIMRGLNPRIWAFSDYPKAITDHVPPQTDRERSVLHSRHWFSCVFNNDA